MIKVFVKSLDEESNERMRVKLSITKGELVDIVFQYESFIATKWTPIVRYDLAHGSFHLKSFISSFEKKKKR